MATHLNHPQAHVYRGDCNSVLIEEVFPKVSYEEFRRGLCLLDPYGLDLNWEVIQTAGTLRTIDIFLNFPVMDINRNVLWANPTGVDEADIARMNAFWGDESWRAAAYIQTPNLFGELQPIKESNRSVALAFQERLKTGAGFEYVSDPLPMHNTRGAIVYYLFLASQKLIAGNIIRDIFRKYRNRGVK